MKKDTAIKAENITKIFEIPHEKIDTMRSAFVNFFHKNSYEKFYALKDVSLEVKKGEFFGIIGRNGSGKSTLLKILAGIYQADGGQVEVSGRISPFLELGIGFNPELSGRDNIYLNGAVLGLTKKEVADKFNEIVKFSELDKFIDQKLKNYSSGMQVRLAFAVAIHANREILLMDEVLAVGDANFQQKCLEEFSKYKKDRNKSVILVTHDLSVAKKFCDRMLLLESGLAKEIDSPENILNSYMNLNMGKKVILNKKTQKEKKDLVSIEKVNILNENNEKQSSFNTGEEIKIRVFFEAKKRICRPVIGIALHNEISQLLAGPNSLSSGIKFDFIEGKGFFDITINNNPFFSGIYNLTIAIHDESGEKIYCLIDKGINLNIESTEANQRGSYKLDINWKLKKEL